LGIIPAQAKTGCESAARWDEIARAAEQLIQA
jgi:hypothetical protein